MIGDKTPAAFAGWLFFPSFRGSDSMTRNFLPKSFLAGIHRREAKGAAPAPFPELFGTPQSP
jgi:hypothetical protein